MGKYQELQRQAASLQEQMLKKHEQKKRDSRMTVVALSVQVVLLALLFGLVAVLRKAYPSDGDVAPPEGDLDPLGGPDGLGPGPALLALTTATTESTSPAQAAGGEKIWMAVAGRKGIQVVSFDAEGMSLDYSWSGPSNPFSGLSSGVDTGFTMVASSQPGVLYAAQGQHIQALSFNKSTGAVSMLAQPQNSTATTGVSAMAVDPKHRWLLTLSVEDHSIEVFPLSSKTQGQTPIGAVTGGPQRTRELGEEPAALSMVLVQSAAESDDTKKGVTVSDRTPAHAMIFVPCSSPGRIRQFHLDSTGVAVKATSPSSLELESGAKAKGIVMTSSGRKAFVLVEGLDGGGGVHLLTLLLRPNNTLVLSSQEPLSVLPQETAQQVEQGTIGAGHALDLQIDPEGKYIAASAYTGGKEDGSSTQEGYVAVYELSGTERVVRMSSQVFGYKPSGLSLITTSGSSFLVVTDAASEAQEDNVVAFKLQEEGTTGFLSRVASTQIDDSLSSLIRITTAAEENSSR